MPNRPAIFRSDHELFHADTCDPLQAAADRGELDLWAMGRGTYPGQRLGAGAPAELCSMGLWDAHQPQSWGLDWHRNEGLELTYVLAGHLPFSVDGRTHELGPGAFTITRPWQRHRVGNPTVGASRLFWLILDLGVRRPNQPWKWPRWMLLDPTLQQRLTDQLRHHEATVWQADKELALWFDKLALLCREKPDARVNSWLRIAINGLYVALAEHLNGKRLRLDERLSSAERTVSLFLEELRLRVEEPWTLETMAAECGIGRSRFNHHCRKLTNLTPLRYLIQCRLEHARRLLSSAPEMSITDVAFASGFSSSQYFATTFRRAYGQTPRRSRSA